MEEDIRGFDLRVEHFKLQLTNIINACNLPISIIKLILKELSDEAQQIYTEEIDKQYKKFCKDSEMLKEEEQDSSSDNN